MLWARTDPTAELLVVDAEQMADMDTNGAEEMLSLFDELRDADVDMWLVRLHGDARITAEKAGVVDRLGEDRILANMRIAVTEIRTRFPELAGPPETSG